MNAGKNISISRGEMSLPVSGRFPKEGRGGLPLAHDLARIEVRDRVHASVIDHLQRMIVRQLPFFPPLQIPKLPTGAALWIAGCESAVVLCVPGIGSQKPSSADRAFPWGVADRKPFEEISSKHPHNGDIVNPLYNLWIVLAWQDRAQILHGQIDQRHPDRISEGELWGFREKLAEDYRIVLSSNICRMLSLHGASSSGLSWSLFTASTAVSKGR